MNRSELLDRVYRFYPRGLVEGSPQYNETEQYHRQQEAVRRGAAEYPRWKALLDHLDARYPVWDHALMLLDDVYDSGYSGDVTIPGCRIGFQVSLLGPFYGMDRTGDPGEEAVAIHLAREIESAYPGYEPIPPELGEEIVPDVCPFERATIHGCLLSLWLPDDLGPFDASLPEDDAPVPAPERTVVRVKYVRR
jgi:hypothetical protein